MAKSYHTLFQIASKINAILLSHANQEVYHDGESNTVATWMAELETTTQKKSNTTEIVHHMVENMSAGGGKRAVNSKKFLREGKAFQTLKQLTGDRLKLREWNDNLGQMP